MAERMTRESDEHSTLVRASAASTDVESPLPTPISRAYSLECTAFDEVLQRIDSVPTGVERSEILQVV